MKSFWFFNLLILCSLFQLASLYLFHPPGVQSPYLVAARPKLSTQFVEIVTPLSITLRSKPMYSTITTTTYKPFIASLPKAAAYTKAKNSIEQSLVPHISNSNTVFTEISTDLKKSNGKKVKGKAKNEIDDWNAEVTAEKEHKKKLSDILPLVTFDCFDRTEGYYADVAFKCEVFHYCGKPTGKRFTFFCPPGSRFNQIHLICDYEMFQGCDKSHEFFHLNDNIHPKDENSTSTTKSHYENTTPIPLRVTSFTYKSVSTTQRQITVPKPKPKERKNTLINRSERSGHSQRRWTMPIPQGPMLMRIPSRMGRLQPSASHMPPARVLMNPHLIPRIRSQKPNQVTKIAVPVPAPRRAIHNHFSVMRPHLASNRRSSHLQYFPPAHEFRRRPLPPPELAFEYDEPPLESIGIPRMDIGGYRERVGNRMKQRNWKLMEDDWTRGIDAEEDERSVKASRRSDAIERKVEGRDKWQELDKAAAHWKMAAKRRQQNAVKTATETEESEEESSEEEVTTKASRRFVERSKPDVHKRGMESTTSPNVMFTSVKTTTARPVLKTRVKNSRIGGRLNTRKKTSTSTMSSVSLPASTTTMVSTTTGTTSTGLPFDIRSFTELTPESTTTRIKHKHKHRFTKVQRTRLKTSTLPTLTTPSSTMSFAITIKPVTSTFSTTEVWREEMPTAAAFVDNENPGENEKSYI